MQEKAILDRLTRQDSDKEQPMPQRDSVMLEHEIFVNICRSAVISEAEAKARFAHVAAVEIDTFRKWTRKAGKDLHNTGARGPLGRIVAIMRECWLINPAACWSLVQFLIDEYELLVRAQAVTGKPWNRRHAANDLLDAATEAVKALGAQKDADGDKDAYQKCLALRGTLDQVIEQLRRDTVIPAPVKPAFNAAEAARLQLASKRMG